MTWEALFDTSADGIVGSGTCVIELFSTEPGDSDSWTQGHVKRSASWLLNKCILAGEQGGGSARRLGRSSRRRSTRNDSGLSSY